MKGNLAWLISVLVMAALAAAQSGSRPVAYSPEEAPERFSFYCSGNNHAKAYTGFTTAVPSPPYTAESSTLDHP